jgi:hypothetical protein
MIPRRASEGEVCGDLRQPKFADQGTIRVVAVQAVMSRSPETAKDRHPL